MRNFDALMSQGENEELVPNESKIVRMMHPSRTRNLF